MHFCKYLESSIILSYKELYCPAIIVEQALKTIFFISLQSSSSNKVQFNETKESVTSQSSLTPQYTIDSSDKPGVYIGGRHQRRLSRTAIDRLGLMRQTTVPPASDTSFAVHSVDSDVVSEPSLLRGGSVVRSVDEQGQYRQYVLKCTVFYHPRSSYKGTLLLKRYLKLYW